MLLWREARCHWFLTLLNLFGIALGTAVFLAVRLANQSAGHAFERSLDVTVGKSHLEVTGAAGVTPDDWLPRVQAVANVAAATPLLEGYATLPDRPGDYVHLLGVDLFSAAPFQQAALPGEGLASKLDDWLGRPAQVVVTSELARRLGLKDKAAFRIRSHGREHTLHTLAILPAGQTQSFSRIVSLDIGWTQELLGQPGELSSIQVMLADPAQAEGTRMALEKALGSGARVQAPAQRSVQLQTMVAGFQLNLTAMSLVSLLVGVFLVYNTVSASVVRRRRDIGILHSLGAERWQILSLFLGEAALYGLVGSLLGMLLGVELARSLLGQIGQSMSVLYQLVSMETLYLPWGTLLAGGGLGLAASLAGSWLPAREAARLQPLQALPGGDALAGQPLRVQAMARWGVGALLLAGALAVVALKLGPAWVSFASCFFLLAGSILLVPWLVGQAGAGLAHLLALFGEQGGAAVLCARLAVENLRRSPRRSGMTIAALLCAVAMMTGVTVMIGSFRNTVQSWVQMTMAADYYIGPAENEVIGMKSFSPPELVPWLRARPEIKEVDTYREVPLVARNGRPFFMAVIGGELRENMRFTRGTVQEKRSLWQEPDAVFVNEPYARKFGASEGSMIPMQTPQGWHDFKVAGVFYDYSHDMGQIFIRLDNYRRHWQDARIHSVAVFLQPGAQAQTLENELQAAFSAQGEMAVYSNADLKKRVFEVFDQTFRITNVLRIIAILVALTGVILTLTTLVSERTREIGLLRAAGATPRQVGSLFWQEAAWIGLFGSVLGVVAGLGLAAILTWVVNIAFFGWTIQFQLPWMELCLVPFWMTPIAILAGWWPARVAACFPVMEALRL